MLHTDVSLSIWQADKSSQHAERIATYFKRRINRAARRLSDRSAMGIISRSGTTMRAGRCRRYRDRVNGGDVVVEA